MQQAYPNSSFGLIWYYWLKKHMIKKNKKSTTMQELSLLKQKYRIESIETQGLQNPNALRKKIQQIREKTRCSNLSIPSSLSATTNNTNSLTNPPLFYTINPEQEAREIEDILLNESEPIFDQQEVKQMINQLHSYYLNSKTIFVIFKHDKQSSIQEAGKLAHSSCNEGSLLNSKINLSSILNEDDSLGERNDSMLESYDKMEDKIENLELLSKFVEIDGMEIWNVKYYSIPHCFVKIKKNCWAKTFNDSILNATASPILHPSQPKTVCALPIIPRITKYRPSIDKLEPFVSFLEMLWQKTPNLHPLCQSIFEYNGLPYIFTQDVKQESIAVLCFYIVFGNEQGTLSERSVERWMEGNPTSILSKTIVYMRQVVRNRNNHSKQTAIKGLFDQSDIIW